MKRAKQSAVSVTPLPHRRRSLRCGSLLGRSTWHVSHSHVSLSCAQVERVPLSRFPFLGVLAAVFFLLTVGFLPFAAPGAADDGRANKNNPDERRYRDSATGRFLHDDAERGRAGRLERAEPSRTFLLQRHDASVASGNESVPGQYETADEVGPSLHIGGDPVSGPAAFNQEYPAIAFDGTNYLIVWEDDRGDTRDIYGARISAAGTVLDSSGIAISTAPFDQRSPAVAFDGINYLVTWEDYRTGSEWDIYGARVSVSGAVFDTSGIPVSTAGADQRFPAVGYDGASYLVAWDDSRGGIHDIYAARVDISGSVRDPAGIPVSTATGGQYAPAIAFDGANYLVVWDDDRSTVFDIYGARVDTSGTVLDPPEIAISASTGAQWYPAVEFDGSSFLVVWDDLRNLSWDVYGTRVDTSGAVRDTAGVLIAGGAGNQYSPDLAFDGTNYFVAWDDDRGASWDVYGARVDTSLTVLDASGVVVSAATGNQYWSRVAFGSTDYLVVWQDNRGSSWDVYGARVDTSATLLDPEGRVISITVNGQLEPSAAFGGAGYLVVWEDDREDSAGICGTRLDVSGTVLDPGGIIVSAGTGIKNDPAAAFGGANYLVVWTDYRSGFGDIYGARVDTLGAVLDPAGIPISSATDNQTDPAVAFDGTNFLVVWTDHRTGFSDIYGARVGTSGTVLDGAGVPISEAGESQGEPSVAFSGKDFLVVWEDARGASWDIYGARVDTSGTVRDPGGIWICGAAGDQSSPAVGFDSTNCLVIWEDGRSGSFWDIYGARVDTSGAVLDASGFAVSTAANDQISPAVAFYGTSHLVVWDDGRTGSHSDIYGARVALSGTVLDPDGVAISVAPFAQHKPTVTSGPVCAMLLAYESFTPFPYGAYRILGNIWSGPTSLAFASATATAHTGYVTLSWQMGLEVASSAFSVERSESPEGGFQRLDVTVRREPRLTFYCTDDTVLPEKTYWYRILLTSPVGTEVYGPIQVRTVPLPNEYRLYSGYPNPFNPLCTIRYETPREGRVVLRVFDVRGSLVRTLLDGFRRAGEHSEVWNGRGEDGRESPSGVYFCCFEAEDFIATRKVVLLR